LSFSFPSFFDLLSIELPTFLTSWSQPSMLSTKMAFTGIEFDAPSIWCLNVVYSLLRDSQHQYERLH